jgi:citrate lyase gamma subunit
MIVLKSEDIIFTLDSSQNTQFENGINANIKELINNQVELIVKTSLDEYKVSNGYFETYLANNLKNFFEIIEVKDEMLQEENKKEAELIY